MLTNQNKYHYSMFYSLFHLHVTFGNAGFGLAQHGLVWHCQVQCIIYKFKITSHI
jgi:hypothetical protein